MTPQQKWFLQPISVPLQKEQMAPAALQAGAAAVVSKGPRSFEVFWDGSELELSFGSSSRWDLDLALELYRQHVNVGLAAATGVRSVSAGTGGGEYPVPRWLPKLSPSSSRFFFVGNEQGHCFAAFDTKRTGRLMTPLLAALRRSRLAWIQFEWFEESLQGRFGDLKWAMLRRWNEIDAPVEEAYGWTDPSGRERVALRYRNHPARFGEFHTYHGRLREHIEAKVTTRLVAMVVRGVVDFGRGSAYDLPFDMVEDSGEARRERWLGTSQAASWGGESKLGENLKAWWTDDPRMILDMVQRRAFDVRNSMDSYAKDYLSWRSSLPFVVLGREEVGLLVHPPSSGLAGLNVTRVSGLPRPPQGRARERDGIAVAAEVDRSPPADDPGSGTAESLCPRKVMAPRNAEPFRQARPSNDDQNRSKTEATAPGCSGHPAVVEPFGAGVSKTKETAGVVRL